MIDHDRARAVVRAAPPSAEEAEEAEEAEAPVLAEAFAAVDRLVHGSAAVDRLAHGFVAADSLRADSLMEEDRRRIAPEGEGDLLARPAAEVAGDVTRPDTHRPFDVER